MAEFRPTLLPLLALALQLATPTPGPAQEIRSVGGFAGLNSSKQLWSSQADATESRGGITLGAFVDVAAPPSWLGVLAEASYSQRGAKLGAELTGSVPTEIRTDYLTGVLAPTIRWFHNPVGLYLGGGLAFEYLISTSVASELTLIYNNPTPMSMSGVGLAGLEYLHEDRWWVRIEGRVFEGIRAAYTSKVTDIRYRAFEAVLKIGKRPESPGPPR